eukprot:GHVT01086784.1.p1 GENE.GHVT01086784.1~~GHVT01086784.1.p1  ORF type:complete len:425 (-),score=72.50 GHVT01086784.1:956-2230(-)
MADNPKSTGEEAPDEKRDPSQPGMAAAGTNKCMGCKTSTTSSLTCPTCAKLKLPPAIFCTQECFRSSWSWHKQLHKAVRIMFGGDKDKPRSLALKEFNPLDSSNWFVDTHLRRFMEYKFSGDLRPWPISRPRVVPEGIPRPDYAVTGLPAGELAARKKSNIHVHSPEEIERIRAACTLAREALDIGHALVKPGVTTDAIDAAVHKFIVSKGAYPSPLNYHHFPKSCCTSVNEVICHGIPDHRPLQEGDLVNIDITAYLNGMHGDLNETYAVGKVSEESTLLVDGAYVCLMEAIQRCKPGVLYRDIGNIIDQIATKKDLSVVRSFCGHGVGALFHTTPNVPHYKNNKAIGEMKPGHVFTIEPMINQGIWKDTIWPDDWTAVTLDGQRSAQFEHTLLITETGVEILTCRLPTSPKLFFDSKGYDLP